MDILTQEKFYNTTIDTIGAISKLPIVRVDRDEFLRKQFKDSPYLEDILRYGPQKVYSMESISKKAKKIVNSNTTNTALISFATGIPSNPLVMFPAGGADIAQYFGFSIHMAQQIAYLFGEDNLFHSDSNELSEEAKIRVIAYLGVMLGASGSASLIANISKTAGNNLGKKIANQALTKTTWYPLVKKVAAIIGQKITKKTVEKTITKAIPIIGGVISGGITYAVFKPMGNRLIKTFVMNESVEYKEDMELNKEYKGGVNSSDINIIEGEFTEINTKDFS